MTPYDFQPTISNDLDLPQEISDQIISNMLLGALLF